MIKIKVQLYCGLERHTKNGYDYEEFTVPEGSTVDDLIKRFNYFAGENVLIIMNGKPVKQEEKIVANSVLEFYPLFGGG